MVEKPPAKLKKRLDQLMVERGLVDSRERAKKLIMGGKVLVDEQKVLKPGHFVSLKSNLRLLDLPRFVSRGGEKIEFALDFFGLDVRGNVCLDCGSSTGGFVDCLLQRGARLVIAVDVGYGQLAWKLRQDKKVFLIERQNVRYLKPEQLPEKPDLITADLSFISLTKVFPALELIRKEGTLFLLLVKPQFEAGRGKVGSGGVVKDPLVWEEVLTSLGIFFAQKGYRASFIYSPIRGPKGNVEFFAFLKPGEKHFSREEIKQVIARVQEEVE